jgi:glutathione S-transferase
VYFSFFSTERSPSAISRYINETRRVYGVVEMRLCEQREALLTSSRATSPPLSRQDDPDETHFQTDEEALNQPFRTVSDDQDPEEAPVWLVGDQCSVADLCFLTWANVVDRIGIDLETEFPVFLSFFLSCI